MITHDRWRRIKELFHSAQGRTPAGRLEFLKEVCGDDDSLREELEALLTADAGNDDFLSAPAYEFAAGMLAGEASEFSPGQKVGRYTILCSLGAGGMGQIYLARDATLGRKIALKLISPEFATDPRRVHRFEQEARAASALNHPNVCVIHEIGITDTGRHFIAMEYIQGLTLRDQLSRGPLKPLEAVRIAAQVAAALGSAHAAGIIHRHIKYRAHLVPGSLGSCVEIFHSLFFPGLPPALGPNLIQNAKTRRLIKPANNRRVFIHSLHNQFGFARQIRKNVLRDIPRQIIGTRLP